MIHLKSHLAQTTRSMFSLGTELKCSGTELTASQSLNCSLGQTRTLAKGEKLTFVQDSQIASKNQSPPGCCWAWAKTSSLPSSTSKPHHLPRDWFSCTGNYILNASSRAAEFIRLIRLFFTRLRGSKIFSQYIHLRVLLSSKPFTGQRYATYIVLWLVDLLKLMLLIGCCDKSI